MAPIDAYKKAADQQLRSYRASLLSVKASGFELALTFVAECAQCPPLAPY